MKNASRSLWSVSALAALCCLAAASPRRGHADSAAGKPAAVPAPISMNLWAGDPPGMVPGSGPGADDGTGRYRNVGIPGMLVYLPAGTTNAAHRIAIIACPGGGYTHLTRLEGADGAVHAFTPRDVVVVSLKYRLKPPSAAVESDTLADVKRTVRLVRAHAAEWGIDPAKVGVLGWSEGANLGLNLASHFDAGDPVELDPVERQSSRPDFVVLLSPWPDGNPLSLYPIAKDAPPAFIGTASDDKTAPPAFAAGIADAYRAVGAQVEFMRVDSGGHGAFTIDAPGPGGKWIDRFWPWLATIGIQKR